jgi:hypothetical protein
LKPDQQAAVTEFLSSRLRGLPFTDSLKNSLKVGQAKGGTARDSLQALEMMRKYFREENLLGHYQDRKDKVAWEELKLGDFNGDLSVDPRDFSNWELSLGEHPQ